MRGTRPVSLSILGLLIAVLSGNSIHAEVILRGDATDLRLEARNATVDEILDALRARFPLGIRGMSADHHITAIYQGPLRKILMHVLDGYDYVIGPSGDDMTVMVVSPGTPRQPVLPLRFVRRRVD